MAVELIATHERDIPRVEQLEDVIAELARASRHGIQFASLHECYAVIAEELDEVWDITKKKRRERSRHDLRAELVQIGAMVLKALDSMDNFVGGDV